MYFILTGKMSTSVHYDKLYMYNVIPGLTTKTWYKVHLKTL